MCDAAEDELFKGRPGQLCAHLTCSETLMPFTTEEGAGAPFHTGAMRLSLARVYD
ncbi:hypothetical protein ACFWWA_26585 [Streptomyces goshikiensis]|uniref:hypothetical protein n=1 Tax=Streptomyces goshikiensis TaxID=1942 RepID=UPI003653D1E2